MAYFSIWKNKIIGETMKINIAKEVEKLNRRRKFRNIWHNIVRVLACVVVFVTTYALILPAITMENNPNCGYEQHEHDESCYQEKILNCDKTEDIHEHTEECYEEIEVISKILICEEEHEHEETCYENKLECEKTEDIHEHNESCYEIIYVDVETPICEQEEKEEHKHDESCMTKEINCEEEHEHEDSCYVENITCGKEETQGHTHDENCYKKQEEKLICEVEEVTPHIHNEDCYKKVVENKQICEKEEITPHEHIEECYEIVTTEEITCNKTQHIHNESCYESIDLVVSHVIELIENLPTEEEIINKLNEFEENEDYDGEIEYSMQLQEDVIKAYSAYSKLTKEQKEKVTNADKILDFEYIWSQAVLAPIPLDPYIQKVEYKHKKYYENVWQDVVDGKVEMDDQLKFYLYFEIPGRTLTTTNNTVQYKPPIAVTNETSGEVLHGSTVVGSYVISTDGTITITFNDSYVQGNINNAVIDGHIAFESRVDALNSDTQGNAFVDILGGIKLEIIDKVNNNEDLQVNKEALEIDEKTGTVKYEIKVSSANGTGSEVILTDIMDGVELQNINDISVKYNNRSISNFTKEATYNGFKLTLPNMGINSEYTITYTANIKDIGKLNGRKEFKNDVEVTSIDNEGGRLVDDDKVTSTVTREMLSKSGKKNGENIDWTITINKAGIDISGWQLSDILQNSEYTGSVTIAPNPSTGSGSITVNRLPYKFPTNSRQVAYTVTYSSPAVALEGSAVINNTAILTSPNNDRITVGTGVNSRDNQNGLKKTAVETVLSDKTDGKYTIALFKWKIVFDATELALEPYEQTIDKVKENVWVFKDELWYESIHWITGAQLKEFKANLTKALEGKYDSTFKIIAYRWDGTGSNKFRDPVEVDENLPDEKQYAQFAVVFYGALEKGNKVEVEYTTSVNISNATGKVTVSNYAFLNEKESQNTVGQTHTPVVTKMDTIDPNGGNITYHDINDTYKPYTKEHVNGILKWDIYVRFPDEDLKYSNDNNYDNDGYLTIIEELPKGVTLINDVIPYDPDNNFYERSITFSSGKNGVNWNAQLDFSETGVTKDVADHYIGMTINGYEQWIPILAEINRETNVVKIKFHPVIANKLKGATHKLTVTVVINEDFDWNTTSSSFKNTAKLEYNNEIKGQASQTQVIHNPHLLKTFVGERDNIISYQITVNPGRKDLLADSDTLIIEDELIYNKPSSGTVNASLLLNSVKVYQIEKDGSRIDITKDSVFTTFDTDANNQIVKKFELVVPDNEKIIVEYNYRISGSIGKEVVISNTATLKGYQSTEGTDNYQYKLNIQESNAGAVISGIKVTKVDADNHLVTLQGAVFSLQVQQNGDWVEIAQFNTNNEEGSFFTNDGVLKFQYNVPYRLVEIEAPYGYERSDHPYTFMIAEYPTDTKPDYFDGMYLNNGDSITITNRKKVYQLPETGGIGIHFYTRSGLALIITTIIASLILIKKKGGDDN